MEVIKVPCPDCGQKVSGDKTFYGRSVDCPICSAKISFPVSANVSESSNPAVLSDEVVPSTRTATANLSINEQPAAVSSTRDDLPPPPKIDSENSDHQTDLNEEASRGSAPNPVSMMAEQEQRKDAEVEAPSPLFGILSVVFGGITILTGCITGIIFAPLAVVFGHLALGKAKRSPVQPAPGKTTGLIGTILGYVGMIGFLIVLAGALINYKFMKSSMDELERAEKELLESIEER